MQTYSGTSVKIQQSDFSIIWRYIKQMELEKSKRKSIDILKLDFKQTNKKNLEQKERGSNSIK